MGEQDNIFYELLKNEVRCVGLDMCVPDDEVITLVISRCESVSYSKNDRIVNQGDINDGLYVLKTGLLRVSYYEEDREFTLGIASAPTISISPLGFALNHKAHYMITACTNVEVLKLNKKDFDELLMMSPGFSRWIMGCAIIQMAMFELKSMYLVGSSKDKYESLRKKEYIKKRFSVFSGQFPDVAREVSDRVIASYLGVHPVWLSTIKRELIDDERGKKS